MRIRYYDDPPEPRQPSIFLAGPTSRTEVRTPWRARALELLRAAGFEGEAILPEFCSRQFYGSLFDDGQPPAVPGMRRSSQRILEWETRCIDGATALLAWMPFEMPQMPGLTTRAEVSRAIAQRRQRLVLGMPPDAPAGGHIRYHAHLANMLVRASLEECILAALNAVRS